MPPRFFFLVMPWVPLFFLTCACWFMYLAFVRVRVIPFSGGSLWLVVRMFLVLR